MADQATAPADMADAPSTSDAEATDPVAEAAKWKEMSRKHEKAAKAYEARLREIEDSQKSEQQKLAERAEAAERLASEREGALLRYRVAVAKNIPAELVDRLRGDTEDELVEDADRLLGLLQPPTPPARGAVDQGARGETPALNSDALLDSVKARLGIR